MRNIRIIILTLFLAQMLMLSAMERKQTEAHVLQQIADSLFYAEQYPRALEYFIKGLEAAERDGDDETYLNCTGYISNIYDAFGDYKSAVNYLHKGYEIAKKNKKQNMQANYVINLVMAYCRMGDVENGKKYYELQKKTPTRNNKEYWEYYNRYNWANILKAEGRYEEAIKAHKQALEYAKNTHFNGSPNRKKLFVLYQESEIGNLLIKLGKSNEAKTYGYKCAAHSKNIESNELLANAYKMLADAFRIEGEADSTDKYMSLYVSVSDSVYDTKSFYTAQSKLAEYEDKVRRAHIEKLWYIIGIVGGVLLLVGILLFLVFLNNKRLHAAQRMLLSKNNELEKQDEENQRLLNRYLQELKDKKNEEILEKKDEDDKKRSDETLENLNLTERTDILSQVQKDQLLQQIIDVMKKHENIANSDFNLNMLAEMTQSNTKYVSLVINETYGKNFKTLLNEYRCREASRLLLDKEKYGNYTMQAIYEAVGYTNATSFIRAFKAMYGMTPSTYQKLSLARVH